jgi:hypothetical protein
MEQGAKEEQEDSHGFQFVLDCDPDDEEVEEEEVEEDKEAEKQKDEAKEAEKGVINVAPRPQRCAN